MTKLSAALTFLREFRGQLDQIHAIEKQSGTK
jgi:hypothetical protein